MTPMKYIALAGAALLIVGVILGTAPASVPASGSPINCGSPWARDHSDELTRGLGYSLGGGDGSAESDRLGTLCDDAIGSRGVFAWLATGLALATLLAVGITYAQRHENRSTDTDAPSTSPTPAA